MPRTPSAEFLKASEAWRKHLAEYRRKHPKKSLKDQMRGASKTYKKGKSSTKSGTINVRTPEFSVNVRPRRSSSKKKPKQKSKKRSRRRSTGWRLW